MSGSFQIEEGSVLHVAVGQKSHTSLGASGASGGTFVIKEETTNLLIPLVIAGGAGADCNSESDPWCHAQLEEYGNGPSNKNNHNIGFSSYDNDDGAGFKSDQLNVQCDDPPKSFKSGLTGGKLSGQK